MDGLILRAQGWAGAVLVHGWTYTASPGMGRSSACPWMDLCCEPRDGQEQCLSMDGLMLRAQGWAGAVFVQGWTYAASPGMDLCCEPTDGQEQCLSMDGLMLQAQGWG